MFSPRALTARASRLGWSFINNSLNPQAITVKSFFGVSDVAQRWEVHQNFVYNLIKSGELPCLKIGNPGSKRPVIRIPLDSLEAWEAAQLSNRVKNAQLRQ